MLKPPRVGAEQLQQPTTFHFVRDYEVVRVEQEVPNELLLVLDDGDVDVKDLGNGLGATACYASDVANRLAGWTQGNSKCTLK